MKKLLWLFAGALLATNLFLSTGCGNDTGTGTELGPLLQITDGPLPGEKIAGQGEITVTVEATKGTAKLKAVTILEDGTKLDAGSRNLTINGQTANATQLVSAISSSDVDGFTWDIKFLSQSTYAEETYTISVEDENGKTDEVTFKVTVLEPIEMSLTGVLWNQAGPAGHGGVDLDDGSSTGTKHSNSGDPAIDDSYLRAELRDMGIDSLSTDPATEWRQQVGPINGVEVRQLNLSTHTDFDYDKITTKEGISGAFDDADALNHTVNNSGWPTSFKVSAPVSDGDIFVVKKGSERTYLVRVDKVIIANTNPDDNNDRYEISIKY